MEHIQHSKSCERKRMQLAPVIAYRSQYSVLMCITDETYSLFLRRAAAAESAAKPVPNRITVIGSGISCGGCGVGVSVSGGISVAGVVDVGVADGTGVSVGVFAGVFVGVNVDVGGGCVGGCDVGVSAAKAAAETGVLN